MSPHPKVDCHVHILDPQRYPYQADTFYAPSGGEIATVTGLEQLLDAHGITHALIVGPNSGYGRDNRCLLNALEHSPGRYKGVAVVANDASVEELQILEANGVVGIAYNAALFGTDYYKDLGPQLAQLRELGLWAQVQTQGDQLVALLPMLRDSGVKLLFDHTGRPDIAAGVSQAGFAALLGLAETGRACVKLSGYSKFSADPHPYADARPYVRELLQAYTPRALVWASDWPHLRAPFRIDYGPLLRHFEQWVPDPADRHAIWWDTPSRLFGFTWV